MIGAFHTDSQDEIDCPLHAGFLARTQPTDSCEEICKNANEINQAVMGITFHAVLEKLHLKVMGLT